METLTDNAPHRWRDKTPFSAVADMKRFAIALFYPISTIATITCGWKLRQSCCACMSALRSPKP